jgi:hypothetical protein
LAPIVRRSEFGGISNFVLKLADASEDVVCSFLSFASDPRHMSQLANLILQT